MARALIVTPILIVLAALTVVAQGDLNSVRGRVERRFEVLAIANGVVLTPRFRTDVRSIEVSDSTIALDGAPVSGAELRKRLGEDADIVLQLSYLDPQARRALAGVRQPPTTPTPPAMKAPPSVPGVPDAPAAPDIPAIPDADERPAPRARQRDEIVRIGGSVTLDADETVTGDVVVIGGSAMIDGQIEGELVVVGGSATLGPQADIRRDVTVIGGGLSRDPKAIIRGKVQDVGFGGPWSTRDWTVRRRLGWDPMGELYPIARLMGTLVRIALLGLLTALVMFVARAPVEQIADRVAAEPVKAWIVGFLAEILFVPVLVMTVVVLAISIIGIPLLLLVPVAIVAGILALLVGFTGVAYHIGRLLQQRIEALRERPYAATFAGIVMILSPLLLARFVGLTGNISGIAWTLVGVGLVLEYVVWTTGLGAAALVRFGRQAPPPVVTQPPMITT